MLFRIINTDIILNGKFLKENSVIEMTDQEFQKEKKYFGNYLIPFFDDTNTEKVIRRPITLNTEKNEDSTPASDSKIISNKTKPGRRSKSSSV
jgi:hypothetical protein